MVQITLLEGGLESLPVARLQFDLSDFLRNNILSKFTRSYLGFEVEAGELMWIAEKPEPGISETFADEFVDLESEKPKPQPDMSIKLDFEVKIHENRNFNNFLAQWRAIFPKESFNMVGNDDQEKFYIVTAGLSDRLQELSKKNEGILKDSIAANLGSVKIAGSPVKVVLLQPEFVDLDESANLSRNSESELSDVEDSDGDDIDEEFSTPKSETSSAQSPKLVLPKSSPHLSVSEDLEKKKLRQENELLQKELQKLKEAQQNERNRLETMLITLKLDLMTLMNEIRSTGVGFVLDRLQGRVSFIP